MNVEAILKVKGHDTYTVPESTTVDEATKALKKFRVGAVIVLDDQGRTSGVFSERDLVRSIAERSASILEDRVADHMTREVHACRLDHSIDDLMAMMTNRRIRHLPVIEAGQLVGMVSIGDVVKWRIAETEQEAEALKAYIASG